MIRESVLKFISSQVLIPPPPKDSKKELDFVINQYYNRKTPDHLQKDLDENMSLLFNNTIEESGKESNIEDIKAIQKQSNSLVTNHKNIFNRKRPTEYARDLGIDWSGDDDKMGTTNSPSYPSGHAFQGYIVALTLGDKHPELRDRFLEIAYNVAQSRIDRGVHYPSDIKAGKKLAYKIYKQEKIKWNLQEYN